MHYFDYILEHYTWAGVALLVLLIAMFVVQLVYYIFTYRRIVKYRISKRKKRLTSVPPISVVIPLLSDDYEFLGSRLPRILTQKYEAEYEVVVVFMGDNGDFYEELESMRLAYPTLRVTKLKYNPLLRITPKQVLNLGIKSALHEHIIITTTTAAPASESWLSMMGKGFMRGEIVAGYTAIEQTSGVVNSLIRMSRMQTSIYHLSGAVKGETYNVSRSNFGMTKSVYFAANGFSHHNMNIGENDLFIQKIATRKNLCVVLTPKATVVEHQWGGLAAEVFRLNIRPISTQCTQPHRVGLAKSDSLLYAGTHSNSRYSPRDKALGGGAVDDKIGCGAERRTLHSPATQ